MHIGFAGLGRMGVPMARNLARAGFELTLWNRTGAKAQSLAAELGCTVAESPFELSNAVDVVITMLADDASSKAVHLEADGLFAGTAGIFIEMGTLSPDHIAALVAAAPRGTAVIDAPVSGSTQAACDAQLMIMAGCSQSDATPFAEVFSAIGRQTICLGQSGNGAVMKLAVNSLIHGINQTLAEAMALAEAAGIESRQAFDVIEASAACAPMLKYRRPLYLDEAAHDVTFTVALARKDMEETAALARQLATAMPQGQVTLDALKRAEENGYGARDMAAMLDFMKKETV